MVFLMLAAIITACQSGGNTPASSSSSNPSAAPTPSYDPSWTDLNRVKPGVLAPDFALEDETGKEHRLSDYRGSKYVVLVFYRGYF